MTRDIGQILALLQQQNSNLIDAQQKQWNTPILEVPILGQQQQQRTGLDPSELRKPTSLTIETGSRSSCSLPTVNESAAETSSRLLYPKSLSTQRSLDSARYTCLLRVFTRVPNFQTFFFSLCVVDLEVKVLLDARRKLHSGICHGFRHKQELLLMIRPLRLLVIWSIYYYYYLELFYKKNNLAKIGEGERTESIIMEPSSVVRWTGVPGASTSSRPASNAQSPSGGSSCWSDVEAASQAPLARLESTEEIVFPSVVWQKQFSFLVSISKTSLTPILDYFTFYTNYY